MCFIVIATNLAMVVFVTSDVDFAIARFPNTDDVTRGAVLVFVFLVAEVSYKFFCSLHFAFIMIELHTLKIKRWRGGMELPRHVLQYVEHRNNVKWDTMMVRHIGCRLYDCPIPQYCTDDFTR